MPRLLTACLIALLLPSPTHAAWPDASGPTRTHAATAPAEPLIDEITKAKRLWESDEIIPDGRCADASNNLAQHTTLAGGWSSPLALDGRVYLCYYQPAGNVHDDGQLKRLGIDASHPVARKWLIDADEVIHCFDANTGKTLWKRVFPNAGINFAQFNKGGCGVTPVIDNGRLYWMGSMGKIFCIDAATGKPLWESDNGTRFKEQSDLKAKSLKARSLPSYNRDFNSWLAVADGVVIANTHTKYKLNTGEFHYDIDNGLTGLAADTGKPLWTVPAILSGRVNGPLIWSHNGKSYVIAVADGKPGVTLLEPLSGKVLWTDSAACTSLHHAVIAGDILLANRAVEARDKAGNPTIAPAPTLAAFRLSVDSKLTLLWEIPNTYGPSNEAAVQNNRVYTVTAAPKNQPNAKPMLLCLDLNTGKILAGKPAAIQTNWEHGNTFIIAWGNRLLLIDGSNSDAIRLALWNADTLERLGTVLPDALAGGYCQRIFPAIDNGRVYLRHRERLAAWEFRAAHAHPTPQSPPTAVPEAPKPAKKPLPPAKSPPVPPVPSIDEPMRDAPLPPLP